MHIVHAELVMQVRAAGQSRGADEPDHVALADPTAAAQTGSEARKMTVQGGEAILVAQDHDLAVTALHADKLDRAVARRLDPGAGRRAVIDALVRPHFLQDGMETRRGKAGRDAGEFQRRAQECLADVFALGGVVAAAALASIRIGEPCGAVGLAVIDELGGQDAPAAHRAAKVIDRFVDYGEAVAAAQVAMKIDVAAENIGQLRRYAVRYPGRVRCAEQRIADLGGFHHHLGVQRQGLFLSREQGAIAIGLAFDHQGLVLAAVERENQTLQFALRPGSRRQVLARTELAEQGLRCGIAFEKADGRRIIDTEALQQARHRIAALHPFFAQEALLAFRRGAERRQCQAFHHLLLRDVCLPGLVDRAEGGHHAEERNAHHAGAGPEMPGAMASVVKDLR